MSDTICAQKRRQQANEINTQLMASGRNAMSADMSMEEWVPVVDVDTNKTTWFPRDLFDEYQRLRFTDEGAP